MRTSGSQIIGRKGATFYAIAISVCHIVQTLFGSANSTMTVSSMMHGEYGIEDVCLSTLNLVGRNGVRNKVNIPLTDEEIVKLRHSADTLKEVIAGVQI